jgi:hypothetical protein
MCLLRLFVSESVTGFWGVGEGEADEVADDRCQSVTGVGPPRFRVQIVSTKHCNRPKGRNDGRIASLSHRTRGGYKNLPPPRPPPPHYWKNRRLYKGACFRKFPKLPGTKVQNVRTGVLGFLTLGKGVNTRIDNLRVHTPGFDTRTMSVETIVRSKWLEWRSHECPKVTGTTSIYEELKPWSLLSSLHNFTHELIDHHTNNVFVNNLGAKQQPRNA